MHFHRLLWPVLGLSFGLGAPPALAQNRPPFCEKPWAAFQPDNGVQPYRPLISFVPESRFPHGEAPDEVALAFHARLRDLNVGGRLIHDVPVWDATPGATTAGYYFAPGGRLCRIRPDDFDAPAFHLAWGYTPGRLELVQGDRLRAEVTSDLTYQTVGAQVSRPPVAPFGGAACGATNLHTHGLLVSPYKDEDKGVIGDYVLDLAAPAQEGRCSGAETTQHIHHVHASTGVLRYSIAIPPNSPPKDAPDQALATSYHPSGLFWFHPHPHGYSAGQLNGGASGLITVGKGDDHPGDSAAPNVATNLRLMLLKDMQVKKLADKAEYAFVAAPDFTLCAPKATNPDPNAPPPKDFKLWPDGECTDGGATSWVFTINGVQKPEIARDLRAGEAEVWRLANGSPNVTYRLAIVPLDEADGKTPTDRLHPVKVRILSKDGVAVAEHTDASEILLMPGSRVSVELDRSKEGGAFALITRGVYTGGDNWPAIVLATVKWPKPIASGATATLEAPAPKPEAPVASAMVADKIVGAAPGPGRFNLTSRGPRINRKLAAGAGPASVNACAPLNGSERVIFFVKNPGYGGGDGYRNIDLFGLVAGLRAPPKASADPNADDYATYRFFRRDAADQPLAALTPTTLDEVQQIIGAKFKTNQLNFSPAFGNFPEFGNICVTRADRFEDAETWVLENWSNEFHNFHIHQSRFAIGEVEQLGNPAYFRFPCTDADTSGGCKADANQSLTADTLVAAFYQQQPTEGAAAFGAAVHDSVPVPRGSDACDGAIGTAGCVPGRVTVRIAFNRKEQVGTFVYHCHILEHEDHGMMGLVQVVEPGQKAELEPRHHH